MSERSAPLVQVPPGSCSRTLRPGEAKRVPSAGPLVGYFLACPACGVSRPVLATEAGLIEEGERLVGLSGARCMGCLSALAVEQRERTIVMLAR